MGAARRLYVYLVSGVSLGVLGTGAVLLLSLLFNEVAVAIGVRFLTDAVTRQELSLAIALVAVAGPIFAIHWWFAARSVAADRSAAHEERRSAIRGLYFAAVQLISFSVALVAGYLVIHTALELALGVDRAQPMDAARPLATLLVAGVIWVFHARVRSNELRDRTLIDGAAMWLTRLHRYGAAWIGLLVGTLGVVGTLAVVLQAFVDRPTFAGRGWWHEPLTAALAMAIVGLVGWWIQWRDASSVVRDVALIGEDEQPTRLRAAYFAGVVLVAATLGGQHLYTGLAALVGWALGATQLADGTAFAEAVVGPLVAGALPFAVVGFLHARFRLAEARALGAELLRSTERLMALLLALVGIASLAAGAWRVLNAVLHALVDRPTFAGRAASTEELAAGVALLLVGALLWLPAWSWVLRRRAADPLTEQRAAASRGYLYLVLAGSVIALVPAAALIVFRLLNAALDVGQADLGEELATPVAVLVVAAIVAGYHAAFLRGRRAAEGVEAPTPAAAEVPSLPPTIAVPLVLRLPADTDADELVGRMRSSLPAGATLETDPSGPTVDTESWTAPTAPRPTSG